ncbi:nuclear transport factor 2 family protein [Chitinophaga sp. GCM10012297]|uniref:Nuclear transport factor 2 family protein n=1 Tax=Chitinophaga chungangae TaxID=2821488 RepID=A0ABS3YAP4_9BACT|nr:nuclear transport factor 2 family protein [Chitinophaga chungangae]MBO9151752.1 nuclear transport factor 2 family protein [Chitinophaga chungangae]
MENSALTRQLLDVYYEGFACKQGWEDVIADDFLFTGGNMTAPAPAAGKAAYIEVIRRFSRTFTGMRVKEMIVEGGRAYVTGNYDFVFPNGAKINGDVAEVWKVENGKLASLTIFFDTLTFDRNIPR